MFKIIDICFKLLFTYPIMKSYFKTIKELIVVQQYAFYTN